jgi:hypothetical protein
VLAYACGTGSAPLDWRTWGGTVNLRESYVLSRRVHDDMISRGPWDRAAIERLVEGYYKFGHPAAPEYTRAAHERRRDIDPGLPTWDELCDALADGPTRPRLSEN